MHGVNVQQSLRQGGKSAVKEAFLFQLQCKRVNCCSSSILSAVNIEDNFICTFTLICPVILIYLGNKTSIESIGVVNLQP